jgi:hypothetical protein
MVLLIRISGVGLLNILLKERNLSACEVSVIFNSYKRQLEDPDKNRYSVSLASRKRRLTKETIKWDENGSGAPCQSRCGTIKMVMVTVAR